MRGITNYVLTNRECLYQNNEPRLLLDLLRLIKNEAMSAIGFHRSPPACTILVYLKHSQRTNTRHFQPGCFSLCR